MTLNPQAYKPNPIQGLWSCHDTHVMLALIRTSVFRACACMELSRHARDAGTYTYERVSCVCVYL